MPERKQPTALFVADSHFHLLPDEAERLRVASFLRLLEDARRFDHLVLLGDIFDFWFDYPHFRLRGYEEILKGLDAVRDAGVRMHFVGGNHDIWAADYFHQRYGCAPAPANLDLQLGNLKIRLCHGDGLLSHDWAYNSFRRLVRTRAGVLLAKALHPELLYALSNWLSGRSRRASREEAEQIERKAATWLAAQADGDWDLLLIGHVHHGFEVRQGGRRFAALPGWLEPLGYGMLSEGSFRLCTYRDGVPIGSATTP